MVRLGRFALAAALAASAAPLGAQPVRVFDGADGASCGYFNFGAGLHWRNRLGDWIDRNGAAQGAAAFAHGDIPALPGSRRVEWDITALAQGWYEGRYPNHGVLLHAADGAGGTVEFQSRETEAAAARPVLTLVFADGRRVQASAVADAVLDCSTYRPLGTFPKIGVGADRNALVVFDLPKVEGAPALRKATLELTTTERQYGNAAVSVDRLSVPGADPRGAPVAGLAARYPGDEGITRDADVYMATGFDDDRWTRVWTSIRHTGTYDVVARDALRFAPLRGRALRVNVAKGDHFGLDMSYEFADKPGGEPEEVFFRYYLRFADDWRPTLDGGKLPGISGTYNEAGWGGRKSDGTNGWSLRGNFGRWTTQGNPLYGYTTVGTYAYHADMTDFYGDVWHWERAQLGVLQNNRWYCLEQQVKLNTPGRKDGIFRAWIDGVLAFEKTDVRLRDVPHLRIQKIWMNVYHGGTEVSPHDQHLYIDNVVVARRYIGPMTPAP